MQANQPLWPRQWLMTDARMGAALWDALERVPREGGVIVRHGGTEVAERVADVARRRDLTLGVARDVALATAVRATLVHNPVGDASGLNVSRAIHDWAEFEAAGDANLLFLSPMFATRSHPGAETIAWKEAARIVAAARVPVIALGGMNAQRFAEVEAMGFYGWAGIDAWLQANKAGAE